MAVQESVVLRTTTSAAEVKASATPWPAGFVEVRTCTPSGDSLTAYSNCPPSERASMTAFFIQVDPAVSMAALTVSFLTDVSKNSTSASRTPQVGPAGSR